MSRRRKQNDQSGGPRVDRSPPWAIVYYQARDGSVPALEFLDGCPGKIDAEFIAVLDAVAAAPPPQFSGGGKWEAMHGTMTAEGEELLKRGFAKPAIAVITGMRKPWRTAFSDRDYKHVRRLGEEHKTNHPRRIAT